jgi:hypothetical protein
LVSEIFRHLRRSGDRKLIDAPALRVTATFSVVVRVSSRGVVGAFGGMRVAIGVAFALAPDRLSRRADGARSDTLMTRSFAVREAVLGVGGLLAVASAGASPASVRMWAGLGALIDGGDLVASLAGVRRRDPSARVPALVAAAGLGAELWAFLRPVRPRAAI